MSAAVSKIGIVNDCDDVEDLSLLLSSITKASGGELLAYPRKVLASVRLTYEVTGHQDCWEDLRTQLERELQRQVPALGPGL